MTYRSRSAASAGAFALVWMLSPATVAACEMCWGAALDNPTTRGISMAMLLLIGMIGMVGGGIGAFFYNAQRRSDRLGRSDMVVTEYGEVMRVDDPS